MRELELSQKKVADRDLEQDAEAKRLEALRKQLDERELVVKKSEDKLQARKQTLYMSVDRLNGRIDEFHHQKDQLKRDQ